MDEFAASSSAKALVGGAAGGVSGSSEEGFEEGSSVVAIEEGVVAVLFSSSAELARSAVFLASAIVASERRFDTDSLSAAAAPSFPPFSEVDIPLKEIFLAKSFTSRSISS